MVDPEIPKGGLFSHVYLERGAPARDSERFRYRLGSFLNVLDYGLQQGLKQILRREIGVPVRNLRSFFDDAELHDVLDGITRIWQYLNATNNRIIGHKWYAFVERAMHETNVGYRLDAEAGVHYFVDEEFERGRASALACLATPNYLAVTEAFEGAHQYLDNGDTRGAVRGAFDAVELLAKQIVGGKKITSLGASDVEKHLKPIARRVYTDTARDAANQLLNSLADWINSIQPYRHGQEDPHPPMDLAIAMVSSGASYLRWLVDIDQQANG